MQLVVLSALLFFGWATAEDVCNLPAETGPCKAAFRRFHYNSESGRCELFIYGGCRGNGNNFETQQACESKCSKTKRDISVCRLPKESGLCMAYFPRYFFNHNTGVCEKFVYGGCGGNANNFQTLKECEDSCLMKKREVDVCSLPAVTGPCRAYFPRYHFNKASGQCEKFVYGGCQGNENNFETEEECQGRCGKPTKRDDTVNVCRLPSETGPCRAYIPSVFFNHKTGQCENFVYGGCGGNENRFATVHDCENRCLMKKREADVCSLPAETGPCRAAFPRFHFNKQTGKCERFTYGGCAGNENNFKTEAECEQQCAGKEKRNVNVCRLPKVTGPCRAAIPRVFFNHNTGQCEQFIYGGCRGNENNFGNVHECENSCLMKKREADVCSLPAVTGDCRAAFRRFHFNSRTGKCELFTYGGCGGNKNNFNTEEDCRKACQ